jgi:hypothetical protein
MSGQICPSSGKLGHYGNDPSLLSCMVEPLKAHVRGPQENPVGNALSQDMLGCESMRPHRRAGLAGCPVRGLPAAAQGLAQVPRDHPQGPAARHGAALAAAAGPAAPRRLLEAAAAPAARDALPHRQHGDAVNGGGLRRVSGLNLLETLTRILTLPMPSRVPMQAYPGPGPYPIRHMISSLTGPLMVVCLKPSLELHWVAAGQRGSLCCGVALSRPVSARHSI